MKKIKNAFKISDFFEFEDKVESMNTYDVILKIGQIFSEELAYLTY